MHMGRQAIQDAGGELYGYELHFRDTATALHARADGDEATTATILAAFSEFGAEDLLGHRPGFINLTRAFLVGELPLPFAPGAAVLEVLESVQQDDDVVVGALRLAGRGYRLALDDYVWTRQTARLLEAADIVKVDVLATPWDEVLATVERCREHRVVLLAEKVEDAEMHRRCVDAGFGLFQGYHLGRPETLTRETLSPAQVLLLQLLGRLGDPETGPADVEDAVRRDPALAYRMLQIANSAAAGTTRTVASVRDALVLVGLARLRAWLVLLAAGGDAGGRLTDALTRARTCELVARDAGLAPSDAAFTAGLLHGVAESMGMPPELLPARMPSLSTDLADALTGAPGPLRAVLGPVLAYERQDLAALAGAAVPLGAIAEAYLAALAWTAATTRALER